MGRKPSRKRKTVLVVGEGATEKALLHHLKACYQDVWRDRISLTISDGKGGSPQNVVDRAKKVLKATHFTRCVVLVDWDLVQTEEQYAALDRKAGKSIQLLCPRPCIEGFLLGLKEPDRQREHLPSATFKAEFHTDCLPQNRMTRRRSFEELDFLSRESLDQLRTLDHPACQLLNKLLGIMFE